jgi:hypothetical protein
LSAGLEGTIPSWQIVLPKIYVIVMNESESAAAPPFLKKVTADHPKTLSDAASPGGCCCCYVIQLMKNNVAVNSDEHGQTSNTSIGGTYCKPSTKAAASELCKTESVRVPGAGGADTLAPDACATMHRHVCIVSQGIVGALKVH